MPAPVRPPSPPATDRWLFLFQRDYFQERGRVVGAELVPLANNLRDAIEATCHSFGVRIAKGRIYFTGERVCVIIALEAGEWNEVYSFRSTVRGNTAGRVCAKILRLLDAVHEELG